MPIKKTLNKIRKEESTPRPVLHNIGQALLALGIGMLFGIIVKYSDTVPSSEGIGRVWNIVSSITTDLAIWVLLATIIAAWSRNPRIGALKVFLFLGGMLLSYYLYSMWLFGFFPHYYFTRWGIIAVASLVAGYLVWFSMGKGWVAALCAATPIGFLITTGFSFWYAYDITKAFAIFSAIILFFLLAKDKIQRLRVFPLVILVVLFLRHFDVLPYLFGGL